MGFVGLFEYSQQTCYRSEKSNPFYERSRQDHVCTNVVGRFRLTRDRINSTFTNLTDTDTGTDSS
jgi:hypothetical protein